jgi:hypothetical protein
MMPCDRWPTSPKNELVHRWLVSLREINGLRHSTEFFSIAIDHTSAAGHVQRRELASRSFSSAFSAFHSILGSRSQGG